MFNIKVIQLHKHFQNLDILEMQIPLMCLTGQSCVNRAQERFLSVQSARYQSNNQGKLYSGATTSARSLNGGTGHWSRAEQVSQRTSVEPVGFGGNGGGSGGGSSFGCETETVAVAVSGVSGDTTRTQAPYVTRAHAHTRTCPPATLTLHFSTSNSMLI